VVGVGIVIPVLPFYVESFGASAFTVTMLFAVFALCSFFSAPLLGSLSDKVGRRPMLLISIASTAFGWLVFALAHNVLFLFIGRIIDGLAAGNFSIAQSYLADMAKTEKDRSHDFGLLGAMFGIGFIVGPILGGVLGAYSHTLPFWMAAIFSFLTLAFAYAYLPETNPHIDRTKKIDWNPFGPMVRTLKARALWPSLFSWFLFTLAASSMQSVFTLYASDVFGFGSAAAGVIMGGVGVVLALNQTVGLKHFWLKYFSEPTLELWMFFVFGVGYILLGVPLLFMFVAGLFVTTFSQSVLRVVATSQIVGSTPVTMRGEMLGVLASIMSLGMIVAPLIAGAAFEAYPSSPFMISAGYSFIAFVVIYINRKRMRPAQLPEDVQVNTLG
jgi:DHA1 family tetracycline resistance protein-like MFS transporter